MAIVATFPTGVDAITVHGLYQWDYGRQLEIRSSDLPAITEVHFACAGMSDAVVRTCKSATGAAVVTIPDKCLEQTTPIMAWLFVINGTEGMTVKTIALPIIARTQPQPGASVPEEYTDKYTELITAVEELIDDLKSGDFADIVTPTLVKKSGDTMTGNLIVPALAIRPKSGRPQLHFRSDEGAREALLMTYALTPEERRFAVYSVNPDQDGQQQQQGEYYLFPVPDKGRTEYAAYEVITTKDPARARKNLGVVEGLDQAPGEYKVTVKSGEYNAAVAYVDVKTGEELNYIALGENYTWSKKPVQAPLFAIVPESGRPQLHFRATDGAREALLMTYALTPEERRFAVYSVNPDQDGQQQQQGEYYLFPVPDKGRTEYAAYEILTTKNPITSLAAVKDKYLYFDASASNGVINISNKPWKDRVGVFLVTFLATVGDDNKKCYCSTVLNILDENTDSFGGMCNPAISSPDAWVSVWYSGQDRTINFAQTGGQCMLRFVSIRKIGDVDPILAG